MTTVDPNLREWRLGPAVPWPPTSFMPGGYQTLHELAVAIAATGREVELRGLVDETLLAELATAAGAQPTLGRDRRRPCADEIVITPEGITLTTWFAAMLLSPARLVLMVLAPPGMFGWPFTSPWWPKPETAVSPDAVARPEHFAAMAACDIDVWTHMHRVHQVACAAGASCRFIGNGNPLPLPALVKKDTDVAYLAASRWQTDAERVAALLDRDVHVIERGERQAVLDDVARTRILLWPARVEGYGRVAWEARLRGTVVVGLASNVYATGLDEDSGALAAIDLDDMANHVEALLADPIRLERMGAAARRSAEAQSAWQPYVASVDAALRHTEERLDHPLADARQRFGAMFAETAAKARSRQDAIDDLVGQLTRSHETIDKLRAQLAGR